MTQFGFVSGRAEVAVAAASGPPWAAASPPLAAPRQRHGVTAAPGPASAAGQGARAPGRGEPTSQHREAGSPHGGGLGHQAPPQPAQSRLPQHRLLEQREVTPDCKRARASVQRGATRTGDCRPLPPGPAEGASGKHTRRSHMGWGVSSVVHASEDSSPVDRPLSGVGVMGSTAITVTPSLLASHAGLYPNLRSAICSCVAGLPSIKRPPRVLL